MGLKETLFPTLTRFAGAGLAERVRYRVVCKYLGGVLLILAGASLLAGLVSMALGEGWLYGLFYLFYAAGSGACGWLLYRMVPEKEINLPEAAAIASLSFLLGSLAGGVVFFFLARMPALDAWFEAMSGFTTTGFSLLDVEGAPASVLFYRALSQWLGGIGFVMITVSLLMASGSSAVTFLKEESREKLFPRMARHVQIIALTYMALTVLGVAGLLAAGLSPFEAVCYTLSGISTGGFAVHAGGVADLPYRAAFLPLVLVMCLGSVSLILYYRSWRSGRGVAGAAAAWLKNPQVVCLGGFIVVLGLVLSLSITGEDRLVHGFFTAVSAQTTTGYQTIPPSSLPPFALLLVIGAMFVGGSMGSTAGGVKIFRVIHLAGSLNRFLLMHQLPRETVVPGGVAGKDLAKEGLAGIFYVTVTYVFFIFAGTVLFTAWGFDPLSSLFEVTSAVGTVGLSMGIVDPGLAWPLKAVLAFLMWAGRLEFIAVLIWFYSFAAAGA